MIDWKEKLGAIQLVKAVATGAIPDINQALDIEAGQLLRTKFYEVMTDFAIEAYGNSMTPQAEAAMNRAMAKAKEIVEEFDVNYTEQKNETQQERHGEGD